jgi:hypothetical protein
MRRSSNRLAALSDGGKGRATFAFALRARRNASIATYKKCN